MDDLDRRLISLLRQDARTPTAGLAKELKVSRGTVQNRLARLLQEGVVLGFTVRVRDADAGPRVRAVMCVEISGGRSAAVIRGLRGIAAVTAVHTTNGRWDLVAELDAGALEEFSGALDEVRSIEGITATETSLLLKSTRF